VPDRFRLPTRPYVRRVGRMVEFVRLLDGDELIVE
jgi:hypothetical protein